jgi:hypothetical protein
MGVVGVRVTDDALPHTRFLGGLGKSRAPQGT